MSSALRRPRGRSLSRRSQVVLVAALGCVLTLASIIFTLAGTPGDNRPQRPVQALPGLLTATEQAAVIEALLHGDSRQRHIASQVAAGVAGASALADPAILHHHGVDTSRRPARPTGEVGAERFHHR
jgi:hypothetical protein